MDAVEQPRAVLPVSILFTFAGLSLLYFVGVLIHRLYIHPLHKIPGPWINAISRVPFARHLYYGTTAQNVLQLHEKYGDVVRLSPNEVSFISGETAWQEIYGHRTGKMKGLPNMQKDLRWYNPPSAGTHIILGNDEDHSRYRRTLAHAFSDRALANQEAILQQYVNLLVSQLKASLGERSIQDMAKWYNWTTFDIIADLTFGTPFGCLRDRKQHAHIDRIYNSFSTFRLRYITSYWPALKRIQGVWTSNKHVQGRKELYEFIHASTTQRMAMETQRPDFMTETLKHSGEKGVGLTPQEFTNNNVILVAAGSETTATLLSAVTYILLQHPTVMRKLQEEVRGRWTSPDKITLDEVHKAPYLVAVLQEALRYFPPAPTGFERRVPEGGAVVSGYYIPEGTGVGVSSYALGRSEKRFRDADSFIPERWMDDPRFVNDRRDIVQPFSFGPRNCLGKNLAIAEMRLILAKMVWAFDFELDPRSENWMDDCRVRTVWTKPPLLVRVKEVARE